MYPDDRNTDIAFFESCITAGDVVIDVGANVGFLTLCAAQRVGPSGKVYALEPNVALTGFLRKNIRFNEFRNIDVLDLGVGATPGAARLSEGQSDDMKYISDAADGPEIKISTLDILFPELKDIGLLKVDVEGFETKVFRGAKETLSRTRCIYFEANEEYLARQGSSCCELFSLLTSQGFELFRVGRENQLIAVTCNYVARCAENFLATKDIATFVANSGYKLH